MLKRYSLRKNTWNSVEDMLKVYRDKVAPSELWDSNILVKSLVNFYLVGFFTESDFPNNFWTSVAIFTKFSECLPLFSEGTLLLLR